MRLRIGPVVGDVASEAGPAQPPAPPSRARSTVAVLSLSVTTSYGILLYAFPVMLAPMQAELGWSEAMLTGAFSAAALTAGLAAIPVGSIVDRHGPSAVMIPGAAAATVLLLAWSAIQGPVAYYAVWIGLGVCMAAVFYEPAFAAVAHWTREHRARAFTAITVTGALASTIFVPLAAWLLAMGGWRNAVAWLAAVLAVLALVPHVLWSHALRRHAPPSRALRENARARREVAGPAAGAARDARGPGTHPVAASNALRSPGFRWLAAASFLSAFAGFAITVHLVALLLARGSPPAFAAAALAALGVAKLPGRLLLAGAGRLLSVRTVAVLVLIVQVAGLVALAAVPGITGVMLFVVLFGAGDGAGTPARADLIAELYGSPAYGRIAGTVAFTMAAARAAAPLGATLFARTAGGGETLPWLLAAMVAAAALAMARVTGPAPAASFRPLLRLPVREPTSP